MYRKLSFLGVVGLVLVVVGCNREGADRLAVKGTVNFEGKPLPKGTIEFASEDRANPSMSGAPIEDGKFEIAQPQGLKAGKYLVRISSAESVSKDVGQPPGESGPVAKERIPASWNADSKQKIDLQPGATVLTFDIK
jgi:hypothetical protein